MDLKDKIRNVFGNFKELKEVEEIYINCLDAKDEDYKVTQQYPSLNYTIYTMHFFVSFKRRIYILVDDITKLKKKLKDYKKGKVNTNKELENLDENINKLVSFDKEATKIYEYYVLYMTNLAREYDKLKNDTAKKIYINTSEEIILLQIKNYLKYEKYILIVNDNIKNLKNVFNF